jgi:hypothetical protein
MELFFHYPLPSVLGPQVMTGPDSYVREIRALASLGERARFAMMIRAIRYIAEGKGAAQEIARSALRPYGYTFGERDSTQTAYLTKEKE